MLHNSKGALPALAVAVLLAAAMTGMSSRQGQAQGAASHYFSETKHTVAGSFWKYWQGHGGLAQQGYPISEEFSEVSDLDGKSYTVQYFERAVFEKHPENKVPYDVLLSQLGTFQYKSQYRESAPGQQASTSGARVFKETGYSVGGAFLAYWNTHGGLAQQGYPISNEFTETSALDGQSYTVQYFERAVLEKHPEKKPPYDVLLSQLGTFRLASKYPGGAPSGGAQPPEQSPQPTAGAPRPTGTPSGTNCKQNVAESRKSTVSHTGAVAISDVHYADTEYVTLHNESGSSVDVSGWTLRDKNETKQAFVFPAGSQISTDGTIQVYTASGQGQYSFKSGSPIWNNCGDAVELLDAGRTVVATYAYGTHLIR
jgi:hypothetical protein